MPPDTTVRVVNPNPIDNEDLFDVLDLGGMKSPGVVKLSGHDSKVEWDIKEGSGQNGATMTRKGSKPVAFTASFFLATLEEQALWPAFRDLINSTVAGKTPKALDIYHPDLAANGITSVVKGSIGGVVHDGSGGQTYAVSFQQYSPPKATGGTPVGSTTKKAVVDPDAAALAQLAALTEQYKRTPTG